MRILVVEDEPAIADIMAEVLRDAGHDVRVAGDGAVALEAVAAQTPDVIFLDLFLPVVTGWDVAETLRKRKATASIPLVVVSAMHRLEERAAAIGTPHYLPKPFDVCDLPRYVASVAPSAA